MLKENVIKVRDMFHDANVKVAVFGDNSNVYDENLDVMIWDDDNALLYVLQRTKTMSPFDYPSPDKVVYYTVLEYDTIQYIQAVSDYHKFEALINNDIPVLGERAEMIKKFFKETVPNRIMSEPGTRTNYQIAKQSPELYDSVHGAGSAEKLVEEFKKNEEEANKIR